MKRICSTAVQVLQTLLGMICPLFGIGISCCNAASLSQ